MIRRMLPGAAKAMGTPESHLQASERDLGVQAVNRLAGMLCGNPLKR